MRRGIVDQGEIFPRLPIVDRALDRDDALPHRGQHLGGRKLASDAMAEPNPLEPGTGHDQSVRRPHLAATG
jgi:hypothetical protein